MSIHVELAPQVQLLVWTQEYSSDGIITSIMTEDTEFNVQYNSNILPVTKFPLGVMAHLMEVIHNLVTVAKAMSEFILAVHLLDEQELKVPWLESFLRLCLRDAAKMLVCSWFTKIQPKLSLIQEIQCFCIKLPLSQLCFKNARAGRKTDSPRELKNI